ncbi:MAG TPA: HNH endonuclease signature motif containing protein [Candidatus Dormibacteraeota bacterium]|nr:HNH endonuclease signature motif containing protein [Candidatus Dormibacteraeota bacterium]
MAVSLRDGGCRAPGCEAPPDLCVPHHERHWADGGSTNLPNLGLYCEVHHARAHPENERFRKGGAVQPAAP